MKLWGGRFRKETDSLVNDFNASIHFDARLYQEDIQGSMAHARMLSDCGIISPEDNRQIQEGLAAILADVEAGRVEFTADNEDIHMNVEALLTQRIGAAGKRLHTARSRNDQVAVDLRLHLRREARSWTSSRPFLSRPGPTPTPSCPGTPTSSGPSPSPLPSICWPTASSSSGT